MEYRSSPASIPLPLSNPLSPALPVQDVDARPQTLIDLLPSNVRDLQDFGRLDLEVLRRAMDDDGASSATGRSVAEDDEEQSVTEDAPAEQTQEVPIASSTVPTGDSLFQALRSPSPEPLPVASTSARPLDQQNLNNLAFGFRIGPLEGGTRSLIVSIERVTMLGSLLYLLAGGPSRVVFQALLRRVPRDGLCHDLRAATEVLASAGNKGRRSYLASLVPSTSNDL